jgi:hypothetical protein
MVAEVCLPFMTQGVPERIAVDKPWIRRRRIVGDFGQFAFRVDTHYVSKMDAALDGQLSPGWCTIHIKGQFDTALIDAVRAAIAEQPLPSTPPRPWSLDGHNSLSPPETIERIACIWAETPVLAAVSSREDADRYREVQVVLMSAAGSTSRWACPETDRPRPTPPS